MKRAAAVAAAVFALAAAVATAGSAPVWKRTWTSPGARDDVAEAVAVDGAGNAWVAGWTCRNDLGESVNILVQKYSPDGSLLWTRTHNAYPDAVDAAFGIAVDAAGNGYVAGTVSVTGGLSNGWLAKLAPDGSDVWTVEYDSPAGDQDVFRAVAVDPVTGTIYVAGCERRPDMFQEGNALVAAFSASGAPLWATSFDGGAGLWDEALGVAVAPGGDVVVAGFITVADPSLRVDGNIFTRLRILIDKTDGTLNTDVVVRRFSPAGAGRWGRTFGFDAPGAVCMDWGRGVAADATGVYVAGTVERVSPADFDRWVRKYSPDGLSIPWTRVIGRSQDDPPLDSAGTPALSGRGRLLVPGWSSFVSADYGEDITLEQLDCASGAVIRSDAEGCGFLLDDRGTAAAAAPDGGVIVVGWENRTDPGWGQAKNLVVLKFAEPAPEGDMLTAPAVWPNPFDPAAAAGGAAKFGGLAPGSRVRIWTPAGRLVRELAVTGPTALWDGRTGEGRDARPGLYWYLIESPGASPVKGSIVLVRRR